MARKQKGWPNLVRGPIVNIIRTMTLLRTRLEVGEKVYINLPVDFNLVSSVPGIISTSIVGPTRWQIQAVGLGTARLDFQWSLGWHLLLDVSVIP